MGPCRVVVRGLSRWAEMFAGDHAGQQAQGVLGRAARVGVMDDQELSLGADDPKPLWS
jgi:hypothetical protein